jgi:thiamine-monophosphate kinase
MLVGILQTSTVSPVGEHALIERIKSRLSMPSWVVVGPGDDAAVIEPERGTCDVFTTDAIVEGVHFDRRFVPLDAIGHRALAVSLSDLAAMGAKPRAALLSLALPTPFAAEEVDSLLDGLLALGSKHGVTIIGGNVTRTPGPLLVDVTAIGSVRPRRILTRAGARPGDDVYVTGSLGDAAAGLQALDAAAGTPVSGFDRCTERYLRPAPRVRAGLLLGRNRAASSCMDLSDGLADAVRQVSRMSGVGMKIDAAALPIGDGARAWFTQSGTDPLAPALSGGDDYEVLFTVRPAQRGRLRGVQRLLGDVPITKVGVVTKGSDVLLEDGAGTRALPAGYEHFR